MVASKKTVTLMAAPTGMQPGGYMPAAFADRTTVQTRKADLRVEQAGETWKVVLSWGCPSPSASCAGETDRFVDACALLAPSTADAPWMSMGAPGKGVEGYLWRPDWPQPMHISAEGLGSVQRQVATGVIVQGKHEAGRWQVIFEISSWPNLASHRQLAFAIWQGTAQERAGLKSVTPGWIGLE